MVRELKVDVVVTWVDGGDVRHQEKLRHSLKGLHFPDPQIDVARFYSSGEVNYCILHLLQHAAWLNNIYIITDAQQPAVIKELIGTQNAKRVKVIDHQEIFRDFSEDLPTFNSLSIETMLWRIPGLQENFIYCNDDIMLMRDVVISDFFRDGKIVLRGKWTRQYHANWFKLIHKKPDAHRSLQERTATLAGFKQHFLHIPHAPCALHRSTFEKFFTQHPELLRSNISYILRDDKQFWPISLMQHLELKNHNAILDNHKRAIMINGAVHSESKQNQRLRRMQRDKRVAFLCIQGMEAMTKKRQDELWRLI